MYSLSLDLEICCTWVSPTLRLLYLFWNFSAVCPSSHDYSRSISFLCSSTAWFREAEAFFLPCFLICCLQISLTSLCINILSSKIQKKKKILIARIFSLLFLKHFPIFSLDTVSCHLFQCRMPNISFILLSCIVLSFFLFLSLPLLPPSRSSFSV